MAEAIKTTEELFGGRADILTTEELFGGNVPQSTYKTVYVEDKGVVVGYPDTYSIKEVSSFIRGDIYTDDFIAPKQLQDVAKISTPAEVVRELDPKLFSVKEQLKYGYERALSAVLEKPAWAVTEFAFKSLKGLRKFADSVSPNYAIDQALQEKLDGWLDKAIDYYSQPEKYGWVTPQATAKRVNYRTSQYQKNFALGIASDITESVVDLTSLFIQMGAIRAVAVKPAIATMQPLTEIYANLVKMGTHGFLTTPGSVTDRIKAGTYRIAYNITPYIANATGATGLGAVTVDTALNTFLTSPTYVEAYREAGGVNSEFITMAIPQFVMDVGMAWNTRGLPNNIRRARIDAYIQSRPEIMQFKDQKEEPTPTEKIPTEKPTPAPAAIAPKEGVGETSEGVRLIESIRETLIKPQPDEKVIKEELAKEPKPRITAIQRQVELTTGIRDIVDNVMLKEDVALRAQLRKEAKSAGRAYVAGKEEIRQLNQIKSEVESLASKIFNLSKRDLPSEYKDIIESELDTLGMFEKERPLKAKKKLANFISEQREKGELLLLSDSEIALADYVDLGTATKDLLQKKYDVLKQVTEMGAREKELIAFGERLDFENTLNKITESIAENIGERVKIETRGVTPSARRKGFVKRITSAVDAMTAHLRKVEFIARTLDGFKDGETQKQITTKINTAADKELSDNNKDGIQFKNAFQKLSRKDRGNFFTKTYRVDYNDKVKILTKEEMLGIYLNSLNDGNKHRLTNAEGWGLTDSQIANAISRLTPAEKALGDVMQKIADGKWDEISKTKKTLTGKKMGKVENYWPIYADKEISKYAQLKEGEKDLFQDVINKTFVEKGMTEERVGGVAPVDLRAVRVFLNHMTRVNHFTSHALAVRDIQKIIANPLFKDTVTKAMGENIYKQLQPWLKDIANPKLFMQDMSEKWVDRLRGNATSAVLGIKVSVSLLQIGSYTQTIKELGFVDSARGLFDFMFHPIKTTKDIYDNEPQMKFRAKSFDRDLRELIEGNTGKELIRGKAYGQEVLFALIRTMDKVATMPTYHSAFQKKMRQTKGDVKTSREFAMGVVRRTQPAGAIKDLPAVMKGSKWKKLWTMFYTHFSNYHNQSVMEFDKLKMGKKNPLLRVADFTVAHLWLTVVPALYAEWVRGGFKRPEEDEEGKWAGQAILGYATGSIPLVRDITRRIIRGKPDPLTSPAFAGLEMAGRLGMELTRPLREEEVRFEKVLEYIIRTSGYAFGLPTEQGWVTMSGIMDLVNNETEDFRRLIYSPYQLQEE